MESTASQGGPLQGLRIVELAAVGPVPMAGLLLSDLGADVWRVDRPGGTPGLDAALGRRLEPRHDTTGRGRRSLALDLKQPAGRDALWRLLDGADVLLEGWRPGVLEGLGFAPGALQQRCPRLVLGRMTGWGQSGPLAAAAGHDLNYAALAGVLHAIGPAERPVPPLNLVADYGGGAMLLAFGVLAALFERQRSGQGQVVDAAMVDGAALLGTLFHGLAAAGAWSARRADNLLDGGAPFYDCYPCADGRHLAVAALEPRFFANLLRGLGLPADWARRQHDRAAWPALREALAAALRTRPRDAWCALFAGQDACIAPVLDFAEAAAHPHAVARGAYVELDGVVQPAPAPRFSRSGHAPLQVAPRAGAHTRQGLAAAGFAPAEIDALLAAGVAAEGGTDAATGARA